MIMYTYNESLKDFFFILSFCDLNRVYVLITLNNKNVNVITLFSSQCTVFSADFLDII